MGNDWHDGPDDDREVCGAVHPTIGAPLLGLKVRCSEPVGDHDLHVQRDASGGLLVSWIAAPDPK